MKEITGAIAEASVIIHRDLGPRRLEPLKEVVWARAFVGFSISASRRLRVNHPFPPGRKPRLTGGQDARCHLGRRTDKMMIAIFRRGQFDKCANQV